MKWLFSFANDKITVQDIDISEWNVSNVISMEGMFAKCKEFNSDISNWNVSKVTDMNCMFSGCKKFNSELWDRYATALLPILLLQKVMPLLLKAEATIMRSSVTRLCCLNW